METQRRIQVATVSVAMSGTLPVFLTAAMAVQVGRDIPLGAGRLGMATGAFFGAAALGSAAMGRLAERIGPEASMRGAAAVGAGLLALLALVPSWPHLLGALLAAGLVNSLSQVGSNLLVAWGVPPGRQGLALALKQAGVPLGTVLGGLAVPAIALTVGWRWAYAAGALGAAGAAVAVPRGAVPRRARPAVRGGDARDVPLAPLVVLAVSVALAAAANGTLSTFLVQAGVSAGLGESAAGLVLTLGSALGIAMRVELGRRADIRGGRHLPLVSMLLAGGAAGLLLLVPQEVPTHLLGTTIAFGLGWAWPGLFNLAVVRLNPGAPAAATGITQTGVYLGALGGPFLFGVIIERAGYGLAWALAAASMLSAAGGVLVGRRQVLRWRADVAAAADTSPAAAGPIGSTGI